MECFSRAGVDRRVRTRSMSMQRRTLLRGAAALVALSATSFAAQAAQFGIAPLPTLGGGFTAGGSINAVGQVSGYSSPADDTGAIHAFLYKGSEIQDLGTLGGRDSIAN